MGLVLALPMVLAFAMPAIGARADDGGHLILEAQRFIQRGDGIAAEAKLKEALGKGLPRHAVAAYMGEALLNQDKPEQARAWLEPAVFTPASAEAGYRALAMLERSEGRLDQAAQAYDKALALDRGDASLWVEVARLRYLRGNHLLAIETSDHALNLDPANVRALELRAQLVRDRDGLLPALVWFEKAHRLAPDDTSVLAEYAATLGEAGQTVKMLALTRRLLKLDPDNAKAHYLQATMAARAKQYGLARRLLMKTGDKLKDVPGARLLEGVLELAAGNPTLAVEALEPLARQQPGNARVRDLLARALFLAGDYSYLVSNFSAYAERDDASPYLQVVVGRAYENLERRDMAAFYLDAAARPLRKPLHVVVEGNPVGRLLADGKSRDAEAVVNRWLDANPASYDYLAWAGDIQLAMGQGRKAEVYYERASRIRMSESLMLRRYQAMLMAGNRDQAALLVEGYLAANPGRSDAVRAASWLSVSAGQWQRARRLLEYLRSNGHDRDVQLLCDLALIQLRTGDSEAAQDTARRAYRLQRSSAVAAQAWGLSLVAENRGRAKSEALLAKARAVMGDNPLLVEARSRLALNRFDAQAVADTRQ